MKCNVAIWDRGIRFILGLIMTTWAVAGGPFWAYLGLYLLFTAGWGLCPIYAFFKFGTTSTAPRNSPRVPFEGP